jgi:hypothetical protein
VCHVKTYNLVDLPTEEDFVKEIHELTDEDE